MNNIEGWTTIGALVIAAISLVSNHLTNKDNLRSRRENIVKEKSIEAYRSLVQKFLILKFNIINKNISEAIKARNECFYTLIEYRLYLPQKLHDDIGTILRKFMKSGLCPFQDE